MPPIQLTNTFHRALEMASTQRLECSSFLGSILKSLTRKQVIAKKELHRSIQVGFLRSLRDASGREVDKQRLSEPGVSAYF